MKRFKFPLAAASVFLITLFFPGSGQAFHEGGDNYCQGCHDSKSRGVGTGTLMIKGSDPSSTCLECHAERGAFYNIFSREGSSYTPGGDFYWLRKNFARNQGNQYYLSTGDSHGHNIVAMDYGLNPDGRLSTAPGGTYNSHTLGCNSCHDPHAKLNSSYRLLAGMGYEGGSESSGTIFVYDAPVASAPSQDWTETDSNHPAYGSGMSEWCTNCHTDMLDRGAAMGGISHQSGNHAKLSRAMVSIYNSYVKSGDLSGSQANAYLALVALELGTTDDLVLNPANTSGPDSAGNANVMCLTCHRSHASAFQSMGRWDFKATFISESTPQAGDAGASGSDVVNSYYGRDMAADFGPYQRQLCNKCHALD
ncbi:MAG: hypothetical protein AABY87_04875 [bacterium]